VNAIKVNPVSLPWQKQFLLRSRVEVRIQLSPSSVCPYALGASGADGFNCRVHSWPVIERIQNVMNLGVALMMDLSVCVLDERLLLFNRNNNPLPRISI
jgi:hypothetical protein